MAVLSAAPRIGSDASPPRFPLVAGVTPLQRLPRLERALHAPALYAKRDDLTGFAVAGNKARKLELLVADALAGGAQVLVTGGGPGSNHIAATAAAARVAGLRCLLVLYGSAPTPSPPNLALAHRFGAAVRYTGAQDRGSVDPGIAAAAAAEEAAGRRAYAIPRGGASAVGAAAYALATRELARQLAAVGVTAATVLLATGSCGTQAGLVAGVEAFGHPWRVVGASVSRPVEECRATVATLAAAARQRLGLAARSPAEVVVRDARGPGYGQPSEDGRAAAALAAATEGLLLDSVYTAKALGQLRRELAAGLSGPVVFLHTGGLATALADDPGDRHGPA